MPKPVTIEVHKSPGGLTLITPGRPLKLEDIDALRTQLVSSKEFPGVVRVYRLTTYMVAVVARRVDLSKLAKDVQRRIRIY